MWISKQEYDESGPSIVHRKYVEHHPLLYDTVANLPSGASKCHRLRVPSIVSFAIVLSHRECIGGLTIVTHLTPFALRDISGLRGAGCCHLFVVSVGWLIWSIRVFALSFFPVFCSFIAQMLNKRTMGCGSR